MLNIYAIVINNWKYIYTHSHHYAVSIYANGKLLDEFIKQFQMKEKKNKTNLKDLIAEYFRVDMSLICWNTVEISGSMGSTKTFS